MQSDGGMSAVTIINNTTYGNSASNPYWFGVSLNSDIATEVVIRNNIAYGNVSGAANQQIQSGTSENDHNLTADPLFVDVDAGNLHVQPYSPAIDAGSPEGAPALDFDGVARSKTAPTIGAYEK